MGIPASVLLLNIHSEKLRKFHIKCCCLSSFEIINRIRWVIFKILKTSVLLYEGMSKKVQAELQIIQAKIRPGGYKTFSMLKSTEYEIFSAHIKMSTVVGNLTFMSEKNSILGLPEP